jgi:hypothetical protein
VISLRKRLQIVVSPRIFLVTIPRVQKLRLHFRRKLLIPRCL